MNAHSAVHYVHFSSEGVYCLFICLFDWIWLVLFSIENLADNLILTALGTMHHIMAPLLYVSSYGMALILLSQLHSSCRKCNEIRNSLQDLRHPELHIYFCLYTQITTHSVSCYT